jgi:hypothetical protein
MCRAAEVRVRVLLIHLSPKRKSLVLVPVCSLIFLGKRVILCVRQNKCPIMKMERERDIRPSTSTQSFP